MNDLIHTAGERVNSIIIQCVHEQSSWNMHISCLLFVSNGSPMYKSLTKTKKYSELMKPMQQIAIIKHYKSSSLITVKRHEMVLRFLKANLVMD